MTMTACISGTLTIIFVIVNDIHVSTVMFPLSPGGWARSVQKPTHVKVKLNISPQERIHSCDSIVISHQRCYAQACPCPHWGLRNCPWLHILALRYILVKNEEWIPLPTSKVLNCVNLKLHLNNWLSSSYINFFQILPSLILYCYQYNNYNIMIHFMCHYVIMIHNDTLCIIIMYYHCYNYT